MSGRSLDESVRELPDIAALVRDDLAALAVGGRAWQQIQWRITGWDGNPLDGHHWTERPPDGAPRLDQQAWDELRGLFPGPRPPEHAYQAYRWAFEVAGCAPPGPALPDRNPMAVLRDLDERLGTARSLPLPLLYVRFLAAREPDPERAEALAGWVRRTAGRIAADAVPAPDAPAGDGRGELHVQLVESSEQDAHLVRIWLHRDGFEHLWESDGPIRRDAVRTALTGQLLGDAARPGVERIEFHVPEDLLDEDFERWQLPIRRKGRYTELGRRFEVVVRAPDERTGLAEDAWRRKWAWFRAYGGTDPAGLLPLRGAAPDDARVDRLAAEDHPVCALVEVPHRELPDTLAALLDAGLPIALWRRGGPPPDVLPDGADGSGLVALITPEEAPGTGPDLERLSDTVRRLRAGGPYAPPQALVLLWDDPEHRPQTRSLS
ncbi:VMAP-C domain-containing protein [Kitasatospora sp. NPDC004240]